MVHGYVFGKAIIYKNNVGLMKSSTTGQLFHFNSSGIVWPIQERMNVYTKDCLFHKPFFCVDKQMFEYVDKAAVRIICSNWWFNFENDYDIEAESLIKTILNNAYDFLNPVKI